MPVALFIDLVARTIRMLAAMMNNVKVNFKVYDELVNFRRFLVARCVSYMYATKHVYLEIPHLAYPGAYSTRRCNLLPNLLLHPCWRAPTNGSAACKSTLSYPPWGSL